jgi:hypothetical protein
MKNINGNFVWVLIFAAYAAFSMFVAGMMLWELYA